MFLSTFVETPLQPQPLNAECIYCSSYIQTEIIFIACFYHVVTHFTRIAPLYVDFYSILARLLHLAPFVLVVAHFFALFITHFINATGQEHVEIHYSNQQTFVAGFVLKDILSMYIVGGNMLQPLFI